MRFNRACDLAGFIERYQSNNIRKITLYSFRSYFFGKAADVHREGYAHKMVGHGGYLPQYDRMNDEKKIEWFIKLEPDLTINDEERQHLKIKKLEEENSELESKKDLLIQQLKTSLKENEQTKRKVKKILEHLNLD